LREAASPPSWCVKKKNSHREAEAASPLSCAQRRRTLPSLRLTALLLRLPVLAAVEIHPGKDSFRLALVCNPFRGRMDSLVLPAYFILNQTEILHSFHSFFC
jgi:hypothetical protein